MIIVALSDEIDASGHSGIVTLTLGTFPRQTLTPGDVLAIALRSLGVGSP